MQLFNPNKSYDGRTNKNFIFGGKLRMTKRKSEKTLLAAVACGVTLAVGMTSLYAPLSAFASETTDKATATKYTADYDTLEEAQSAAMNGISPDTAVAAKGVWWETALTAIDCVAGIAMGACAIMYIASIVLSRKPCSAAASAPDDKENET